MKSNVQRRQTVTLHCTSPWSGRLGQNMRVQSTIKSGPDPFLRKVYCSWAGLLALLTCFPQRSVSFLNRANRSGKYPGSEAVCHFHPKGPISGKSCERQLEEVLLCFQASWWACCICYGIFTDLRVRLTVLAW